MPSPNSSPDSDKQPEAKSGQQKMDSVGPSAVEGTRSSAPARLLLTPPLGDKTFDRWIEHFYKECGREATLAYTTLNQMHNWAMAIVAVLASVIAALYRLGDNGQISESARVGILAAAVAAFVFNLRFFMRAILCYINLLRWNRLQSDIVARYIKPRATLPGGQPLTRSELHQTLLQDIEDYYHGWKSTISRKAQLQQNLKLGSALVLALPLFFVVIQAFSLWHQAIVRGLTVFALGATLVELTDFARSGFFDDIKSAERRRARKKGGLKEIFPVPVSGSGYLVSWALNLVVSGVVGLWPQIVSALATHDLCIWPF